MTKTQTVEELKSQNPVWPAWMAEACEGATLVEVTRKVTLFGSFVVSVERVA